jgi:hypothetical protein
MLNQIWQRWVKVSKKLGDFQARLLLSLFYLVIVCPFGLILRVFADPLGLKKVPPDWTSKPGAAPRLEEARRQF